MFMEDGREIDAGAVVRSGTSERMIHTTQNENSNTGSSCPLNMVLQYLRITARIRSQLRPIVAPDVSFIRVMYSLRPLLCHIPIPMLQKWMIPMNPPSLFRII